MILEKYPEIQRLSAAEKLLFVTELWNELEANPSELPPVPESVLDELDRRMEEFRQYPDRFVTWEDCRKRLRSKVGDQ